MNITLTQQEHIFGVTFLKQTKTNNMQSLEIVDDKLKESYKFIDTHLMNEMINYTKTINEKNSKKEKTIIKDKHSINDSFINPEY